MTSVKKMNSDLKEWGVDYEYRKGNKSVIEPVYKRCKDIKKLYKGVLEWENIGKEFNLFLSTAKDKSLYDISRSLVAHSGNFPESIGKK